MTQKMKILTAVDLSDYSAAIVRYSCKLAKKLDAELLLVNVINQRDLDMVHRTMVAYESFSFPDYVSGQEKDREADMRDLVANNCEDTIACRYFIRSGIPYHELLDTIESEKPDLMVTGTKGRSSLADVIVGSTVRKLYRRSPIPLLTIPASFEEKSKE